MNIEKIDISYPILNKTTEEIMKIAPAKFWGSAPNEVGNLCIVGHNYRNTKFFSKIHTLEEGDIIEIIDMSGRAVKYAVYNVYEVEPEDTTCTSQLTKGKKEITLITCTNDSKKRIVVKARETEKF